MVYETVDSFLRRVPRFHEALVGETVTCLNISENKIKWSQHIKRVYCTQH